MMTLDEAKNGFKYRILSINAREKLLNKLLDMGFIQGAVVEVIRVAPLFDPMQLRIHNYLISLRKSEANLIHVEAL